MSQYGPKWPLKKGNEDAFEMYDDLRDQVSFYIKNLLLTSKGENLSDPAYGVGLRNFLFEQNIESVRNSLRSEIRTQFSQFLPYIDLEDVLIEASSQDIDSNTLNIKIRYRLPGRDIPDVFDLESESSATIGFY